MKGRKILLIALLCTSMWANDSINSEAGHFAGGVVLAGGITAIVDSYFPEYREDRAKLGFGISSAAIVLEEGIDIAFFGGNSGDVLDMAVHIAGSALGAYVTDQYILSPVIKDSKTEGKYIGFALHRSF